MKRSVVRRLSLTPLALGALGALGGAACSSSESAATSTRKPALQAAPAAAPAVAPVTVLRGSLHPSARPERDLGRMDPATPLPNLALLLGRSPAVKRRLVHDQVAIQDPMSPDYHRWLSPEEYGARYGASSADVARASAWLAAHGFHVDGPSVTGSRLSFSGSVGQVESAFNTEVHRYQVGGERHFALSREPQVPADLGTVVAGLHGTHDFRPAPPRTRKTPASPRGKFGGQYALSPADFATIYDINPLYSANITGKGQKIAIVGESYYNPSDVLAFRQNFGLDTTNMPTDVLVPNTGTSMVLDGGDLSESELDMEWSGGIAKDASVYFVYTGDNPTSYGFFDAMLYAVETRVAPIVSVSYGTCEAGYTPSDAVYYGEVGDLAAMLGVTVLVASGDTGAAGCDAQQESAAVSGLSVGFPASIPSLVAVGGTQLTYGTASASTYWNGSNAAIQYIPETAWNQTFSTGGGLGAGGGGYSIVFPRPYWQATALPSSGFRGVPDISFSAASNPVPYLIAESWTVADNSTAYQQQATFAEGLNAIGGTSASTPSFAGILALLNQSIGAAVPGLGNMNPTLYALYTSAPAAFHDITSGSNSVPCQSGTKDCPAGTSTFGYNAGPGYDLATGLGSLDVAKFVNAWTSLAPTSTTLAVQGSGAAEGTNLQLTATIGSAATAHAITGKVTFYFQTLNAASQPDLAYTLGDVAVTANQADAGVQGAVATLSVPAPVGYTGNSKIVAFYGGDSDYLASYSTEISATATTTFAVVPATIALQPHQQTTFTTTGGVPPVSWHILSDGTCTNYGQTCSGTLSMGANLDGFQAGPNPGTVVLQALDSDFAEARVTITVSGAPVDGGSLFPVDAGRKTPDAGIDSGAGQDAGLPPQDATVVAASDAGDSGAATDSGAHPHDASSRPKDAGGQPPAADASREDAGGSSGSSGGCSIAAREGAPDLGLVAALALGFAPVVSRTRRRRSRS